MSLGVHIFRLLSLLRVWQWTAELNKSLEETDPELFDIVEHEKARQRDSIVLIASEVGIGWSYFPQCVWRVP